MAIGERIRFFRVMKGMTQKYLGTRVGLAERTADIRIAQYEAGIRRPKEEMLNRIAEVLDVSPNALKVENIYTAASLMHTFFALEDIYDLRIDMIDGTICLCFDELNHRTPTGNILLWYEKALELDRGEITKEEYDYWRYTFPRVEAQRLKESLDEALRNRSKTEE